MFAQESLQPLTFCNLLPSVHITALQANFAVCILAKAAGRVVDCATMARTAHDIDSALLSEQATPELQRSRTANRSLLEDFRNSKPFSADMAAGNIEAQPLLSSPASQQRSLLRYRARAVTSAIVFAWFCSNIGLLLMNKYLLSNYGFKQPVFLTLCHMLACVVLSTAFSMTRHVPKKSVSSSRQLIKISVLAVVFAMTVVLGNISLKFIPVSFSQVRPFAN